MATAVDGRIVTAGWPTREAISREYERIHGEYDADAWMCGRTTMEPFAGRVRSDAEVAAGRTGTAPRDDFRGPGAFASYAIAVDPRGKLLWQSGDISRDHVIARTPALIDELSVLVAPVADGRVGTPSLVDAGETATPVGLALVAVEQRDSGGVWLRHRTERLR
jgi:hypothetical protein